MKILIIAAHPDDEVLGMGGTIKKYTSNGHEVKIVFMATGIFSRRTTKYENSTNYKVDKKTTMKMKKELTALQNDAKKASKIMGVTNTEFMNFPDNEMDKISNLEVTKKIEGIIEKFQPGIVFTHSPYDINIDHRVLYNATITATRPIKDCKVKDVFAFEVPSSTEWYFPSKFSANIFVDISKELPTKLRALEAYKNEIKDYPHPRSVKALEIISKRWGTVSGYAAAEAFMLVRSLKDIS